VRVEVTSRTRPWPRNPASDRLLEIFQHEGAGLGLRIAEEARGGLSDANHLWDLVPTLDGLGPSGANAHCPEHSADGSKEQEYASRSTFVPKALLSALAVLRLIATTARG
jgi:glutamate carboxypeptidase